MDVVKTNVEKIGGTVDIHSKVGEGTSLRIKIPLTLAIIPALIVTCRGDRFAIPQVSLLELVRLDSEQLSTGIEHIQGAPVHRLRGHLLPLVYLDAALEHEASDRKTDELYIVVLQADDRQFGLVVDEVLDTEEIVVKPLGKELKSITAYAGATIMGDGQVALILDVLGIAQRAGVISAIRERALRDSGTESKEGQERREAMLLFSIGSGDRMALPLDMVSRLEEFQPRVVERVGACHVVQYRGQIMPLLPLDEIVGGASAEVAPDAAMQVIVTQQGALTVGLVVKEILDIVEENVTVRSDSHLREGVLGAAVVQGRVTELLDVGAALRRVSPSLAAAGA
jgi:two-component system chemotaxis sensor kinase CheA